MSSRLALPDSDIACAARQLLFDVSPVPVAHHCVRSYLFARELAAAKGLYPDVDYDDELVYLSCVLHDLGVTDHANGDQRFEVDGADAAVRFLRGEGVEEARVTTVWQAIALHTSIGSRTGLARSTPSPRWVSPRTSSALKDNYFQRVSLRLFMRSGHAMTSAMHWPNSLHVKSKTSRQKGLR